MLKTALCVFLMILTCSATTIADPLHVAIRSLDMKLFDQVMQGSPDVNATDSEGLTPLHYACQLGIVEMVEQLIKKGANAGFCSADGKNALHHAVSIDAICFSPVQPLTDGMTVCPLTIPLMLASAGIDLNAADLDGNTALHLAARNGLVGVIATLANAGAKVNAQNHGGDSALHLVGGPMPHICAQVLLINGADASIRNAAGNTPFDAAGTKGNALLINMFKRYANDGEK